jgi:Sec-independent protein translocase protein TatA
MAGFGTELLLFCGLGYVVLGPKRMHTILQHITRAKAEFEKTQRALKAELTTRLGAEPHEQGGRPGPT